MKIYFSSIYLSIICNLTNDNFRKVFFLPIKNDYAADMSKIIDVTNYSVVEDQVDEKSDVNELPEGQVFEGKLV